MCTLQYTHHIRPLDLSNEVTELSQSHPPASTDTTGVSAREWGKGVPYRQMRPSRQWERETALRLIPGETDTGEASAWYSQDQDSENMPPIQEA